MKRRDLELSHGHSRAVAYQNDLTLGQSACPQIHHHPQREILTSRRGVAAVSSVGAAQTRRGKKRPRDRRAQRLDFATAIPPSAILAGEHIVDLAIARP